MRIPNLLGNLALMNNQINQQHLLIGNQMMVGNKHLPVGNKHLPMDNLILVGN